ncbi:hypothetical protein DYB30_001583 [Aphanomyces astaci]|uniref:Uncharacterized protein n=1 Tax=Aphanomyces astaci TaxID=112090 RepID=A0A397DJV0_APHAT|nr:hypothetical protein DYB30_001583 [Aphanomyces astaci]
MTTISIAHDDAAAPVPSGAMDTPNQATISLDNEPPVESPSKEIETGLSLVRMKSGPKRTSIWDGMVLMVTPATTEETKAQELTLQAKAVRRRLFLMGFLTVAAVAVTIGLSIGLAGGTVGELSTSSGNDVPLTNSITDVSTERSRTDPPSPDPTLPAHNSTESSGDHSTSSGGTSASTPGLSTTTRSPTTTTTTTAAPTTTSRPPTTTTTTTVPPLALGHMLNFVNRCTFPVSLYKVDRLLCTLQTNGQCGDTLVDREHTMYRHTNAADATLVELTLADRKLWYDISAIPPGCGNGMSYADCVRNSGGAKGYNIPVSVLPTKYDGNAQKGNCHKVTCTRAECPDAYLYPFDDLKMKDCPDDEVFVVTFCP